MVCFFFFSSRRRHTRCSRDWSSDVCSSDLGSPELIQIARRVIPPYALTQPTIEAALRALEPEELAVSRGRVEALLMEKDYLRRGLEDSPLVSRVWPSDANFLFIDCRDADRFMNDS